MPDLDPPLLRPCGPPARARPPLVLVPGMMCDERLFGPQIDRLRERYDLVVAVMGRQTNLREVADAILREVAFDGFAACGLSMGGIIAMELAARAPERISRLALLGTNHLADAPERAPVRERQIAEAKAGRMEHVVAEEMLPFYLAPTHAGDPALTALLERMAADLGAEAFVGQSIALRDRPSHTDTLARFEGPTLVLCGEEDRICTPGRHREMAALCRRSELVIVPDAGHVTTLEQPEAVTNALIA